MNNINTRTWLGIILAVIGVLLMLDNFDFFFFDIRPLVFSWRTIFVIIGIILINKNSKSFPGYIFLGIGLVGWMRHMPFLPFADFLTFQDLWPLLFLLTGIWLIITYNKNQTTANKSDESFTSNNTYTSSDSNSSSSFNFAGTTTGASPFDIINEDILLNSAYRIITSENFKGGKINSILSSTKIDLTKAKLAPGEQTLEINAIFGGVQIRVPSNWRVIINVSSVFGGFDDKRFIAPEQINQDSILIIKGGVVFGGGEVLN